MSKLVQLATKPKRASPKAKVSDPSNPPLSPRKTTSEVRRGKAARVVPCGATRVLSRSIHRTDGPLSGPSTSTLSSKRHLLKMDSCKRSFVPSRPAYETITRPYVLSPPHSPSY